MENGEGKTCSRHKGQKAWESLVRSQSCKLFGLIGEEVRRGKMSSEESKDHFWLRDLRRLLEGGMFGTVNSLTCWKNPYGEGIGDKAGKVNRPHIKEVLSLLRNVGKGSK